MIPILILTLLTRHHNNRVRFRHIHVGHVTVGRNPDIHSRVVHRHTLILQLAVHAE